MNEITEESVEIGQLVTISKLALKEFTESMDNGVWKYKDSIGTVIRLIDDNNIAEIRWKDNFKQKYSICYLSYPDRVNELENTISRIKALLKKKEIEMKKNGKISNSREFSGGN